MVVSLLHDTVAKFHTGEIFSIRYQNHGELTPMWLEPAWRFVVVTCKQVQNHKKEQEWTRTTAKVGPVSWKQLLNIHLKTLSVLVRGRSSITCRKQIVKVANSKQEVAYVAQCIARRSVSRYTGYNNTDYLHPVFPPSEILLCTGWERSALECLDPVHRT